MKHRRLTAAIVAATSGALVAISFGVPAQGVTPEPCPAPGVEIPAEDVPEECQPEVPQPTPSPTATVPPAAPKPVLPAKPVAKPQPVKAPVPPPPPATEEGAAAQREAASQLDLLAAAQAAVGQAEAALEPIEAEFTRARAAVALAQKNFGGAGNKTNDARDELGRVARQAYMNGVDPSILANVSLLDSDPESYSRSQIALGSVGKAENERIEDALKTVTVAKAQLANAQLNFAKIKPRHDMARLNVAVARAAAGVGPPITDPGVFYRDFPVPNCSFAHTDQTTRTCQEAMRWAIGQVTMPMKDWYYLCLNLVTMAYGAPQSIPRAIDMWDGLPIESRHGPEIPAPPGALMFWAPNHVAMSLGNNMLVSVDVLGQGRVWIVSLETIQARWNMPYLGWSDPDFSRA